MIRRIVVSSDRCQDLIDYLETMRLPEVSSKTKDMPLEHEEKKDDESSLPQIDRRNDSSRYLANVPYLIYDENNDTIISRLKHFIENMSKDYDVTVINMDNDEEDENDNIKNNEYNIEYSGIKNELKNKEKNET